jgi:entericidin B
MRRLLPVAVPLLALLAAAPALTACNTVAGAGEDLAAAGHAVTSTVTKVVP